VYRKEDRQRCKTGREQGWRGNEGEGFLVGGEEDSGAVTRREGRRVSEKGDRWRGNRVEKGRRNKGGWNKECRKGN
jgi:hypothetical protein